MQSVLDYFDALRKPTKVRQACFKLIKHLEKAQQSRPKGEKLSTEMKYALKRLIRGMGSADQDTVVGFSACLVSLLKSHSNIIDLSTIQEYVESELELRSSLLRGEEGMVSFGRVLVYGSMIRSGNTFEQLSEEDKSFVLDQLLLFCYRRSYISAPVYYYVENFLKLVKFDKKYVKIVVSHLLSNKFHMNLDMLHLLLSLQQVESLPSLLTSSSTRNKFSISTSIPNLQQPDTVAEFVHILIDIRCSEDLNRDVFARFSSTILAHPRLVSALWSEVEGSVLGAASSQLTTLKKLAVFKLFSSLILHCGSTQQVLEFLTPHLLELAVHSVSDIPPDLVPSLSPMMVLSAKFVTRIVQLPTSSAKLGYESLELGHDDDAARNGASDDAADGGSDDEVADGFRIDPADVFLMIQRLLTPRLMNVEKLTHTRILQSLINALDRDHVTKLAILYKDILGTPTLTAPPPTPAASSSSRKQNGLRPPVTTKAGFNNKDRIYALNLLCKLVFHPSLQSEARGRNSEDPAWDSWRYEQVEYVFDLALGVCPWNHELSSAYRKSLISLLGHNLPHEMLGRLVHRADGMVQQNQTKNVKLTPEVTACWRTSLDMLAKLNKKIAACKSKSIGGGAGKKSKSTPVDDGRESKSITINIDNRSSFLIAFQTMYLQLCLYLFLDNSISIDVIEELNHCYERFDEKKSSPQEDAAEPHWIEVITELFLSLLSKDSVLLRHLVSKVFKLLMPVINVQAVQQILQVLDPSKNPLKDKLEESDDDDDEENEEEESEDNGEDDEDNEEESELDEEYLGNESNTDKLRQAVNQALGMNGNVTDAESIDLSDMDGAEAAQLDAALSLAFAAKRPQNSGGANNNKRPSKFAALAESRLVAFRGRVLDLVDIVAAAPCTAPHVTLDILAALFPLLRYTLSLPSQKALETRVRSVLAHATSSKRGALCSGELSEQLLTDVLVNSVLEKGDATMSALQTITGEISSAILYLVRVHSTSLPSQSYEVLAESRFLQSLLDAFESTFTKRHCVLPGAVFKSLLGLGWAGNSHFLARLPRHAFNPALRYYNRSTALALVTVLLRNKQWRILVTNEDSHARAVADSLAEVVTGSVQFLSDPGAVSKSIASYTRNLCDVLLALKSSPDLLGTHTLSPLAPALTRLTIPCPTLARLYTALQVTQVAEVKKKKKRKLKSSSITNGHDNHHKEDEDDNSSAPETEDQESSEEDEETDEKQKKAKKKKHRASKTSKKNKLLRLADLSKGIEDVGGFASLPVDKEVASSRNEGASSNDEGASSDNNEGASSDDEEASSDNNEGVTRAKLVDKSKRNKKNKGDTKMEVDEAAVISSNSRRERKKKLRQSLESARNGLGASSSDEEEVDLKKGKRRDESEGERVKSKDESQGLKKKKKKKRKWDKLVVETSSSGGKKLKMNGH